MAGNIQVNRRGAEIEISIRLRLPEGASMMECEETIQEGLNEAGRLATGRALERFDTDGSPIEVAGLRLTTKGRVPKHYQSPYGEVALGRHVYQSPQGGATYCPLDHSARIINSTTPRFARMCARKYASMKSTLARADLAESHGRQVSRCYLQDIAEAVGSIARDKSEKWTYAEPDLGEEVATIAVGLDGTCVLFCEEGWRSAMVGTISLHDILGERLHTVYVAAPPEHGKAEFLARMEREIHVYKKRHGSRPTWVGIADGARDYWPWLGRFVEKQVLDFYHAAGYLEGAAQGLCPRLKERQEWFEQSRHRLKEQEDGAGDLLEEMKQALENPRLKGARRDSLQKAATYFEHHLDRMNYAEYRLSALPIGSGVTEAACKTVVKERMRGSGMKWKHNGASTVLNLRSLILTEGRWDQFWSKIVRFGI